MELNELVILLLFWKIQDQINLALYGHGGLIAQQGHISLNTNLYSSQF